MNVNWRNSLGELGIIILGILIALAADDWYAGIRERSQEIAWVSSIRDDLVADQRQLNELLSGNASNMEVIRELISSIDNDSYRVESTVEYLRKLKQATITTFFRPTTTTYMELTGGGGLSTISNRAFIRAVIDYHRASTLTDDLNDVIKNAKWFEYNRALKQVIDPILVPDMTLDWYRRAGQWPSEGGASDSDLLTDTVDLSRARSSQELRGALVGNLDAAIVQHGDLYRMLLECENVLSMADEELERLTE
jgi:hypothetical protein